MDRRNSFKRYRRIAEESKRRYYKLKRIRLMGKFFTTVFKGKLTEMGLFALVVDAINVIPQMPEVWSSGVGGGGDISILTAIGGLATLWGWIRRRFLSYKLEG